MSSLTIMLLMVGPVQVSNMPFEVFLVFSYDTLFQTKCNLVKALDDVHNAKSDLIWRKYSSAEIQFLMAI